MNSFQSTNLQPSCLCFILWNFDVGLGLFARQAIAFLRKALHFVPRNAREDAQGITRTKKAHEDRRLTKIEKSPAHLEIKMPKGMGRFSDTSDFLTCR